MSKITIQCQLFADETAKQYLWQLMTERNTPLVNELLRQIALHPDFAKWRSRGKLPTKEVTNLSKSFKTDPRFNNQPAKFHISAQKTALYTFKSWLAIHKRAQQQLEGKLSEQSGLKPPLLRGNVFQTGHKSRFEKQTSDF